jgi:uncharacterized protein (DUF924 family)
MTVHWSEEILRFWFEELSPKDWFSKDEALDAEIERRFGSLHDKLSAQDPDRFLDSAHIAFAAIILFDQLSRNLFRGTPQSFASDPLAVAIARALVANGWDKSIGTERRVFAYLPFEHSEDLTDQDTSVALIEALGDLEFTRYAHAHRDIIVRFGRFPHRKAILGRASTREEEVFLSQPGSGF